MYSVVDLSPVRGVLSSSEGTFEPLVALWWQRSTMAKNQKTSVRKMKTRYVISDVLNVVRKNGEVRGLLAGVLTV